ncbi:hypothetical protein [Cryobacterium arcticum]|uniref:Alpha/beta hydrolase n=1 Tax=Cryobacterium arcticum TaxID=670052 RepID=A0A317ZQQ9_9MICO|nr:hypothetical protein [Cryobacterium arcticum]PXA67075.1 hypothetical protein CTB96_09885 [Cryobacterium arcticum]
MTAELVLIHGRSQHDRNPAELEQQWISSLKKGLAASSLELCLPDDKIHFVYYGDTLADLVAGVKPGTIADVIIKGEGDQNEAEKQFQAAIVEELRQQIGISDDEVKECLSVESVEMGALNRRWVQAILEAIDHHVPGASGLSLALFTRDVYQYLRNPGIRDAIENGVRRAIKPGVPAVVVGHSLGSVVAYNVLKREGNHGGWSIPLLVTLGSPLAVGAIRQALTPNHFPESVSSWFNAMDDDDVVSLYPLDQKHFPLDREIENHTGVDNWTKDKHGIEGYLGDPIVARKIHEVCCT